MLKHWRHRLKKRWVLLCAVIIATTVLATLRLIGTTSVGQVATQGVITDGELTPLQVAANKVSKGLNRLFPLLEGTALPDIPFEQASRTEAATNSDGDFFPDWIIDDFGTVDDDGYGGIVKVYDEGNTLKYVLENFQTPSETWTGWLTSPDTDEFPAGHYAWDWSIQTTQGTEHWQGNVTVSQQGEEQFLIRGTLNLSDPQGNFQLTISDGSPITVDATHPALLVGGQGILTFITPDGVSRQGVWSIVEAGRSRLWLDENGNGLVDSGEEAEITYDSATGTWQVTQQAIQ